MQKSRKPSRLSKPCPLCHPHTWAKRTYRYALCSLRARTPVAERTGRQIRCSFLFVPRGLQSCITSKLSSLTCGLYGSALYSASPCSSLGRLQQPRASLCGGSETYCDRYVDFASCEPSPSSSGQTDSALRRLSPILHYSRCRPRFAREPATA